VHPLHKNNNNMESGTNGDKIKINVPETSNPIEDYDPDWHFEDQPIVMSPFLKKPMFVNDWHFDKLFDLNDYWEITQRTQGNPRYEVIVQTEPEEIKMKLPCLHQWADNLGNLQILMARQAIFEVLVGQYKWSEQDAINKLVPEWNMKRFTVVYDEIGGDEKTKWVRTWDKVIKDKSGFENPTQVQKDYLAKIQRCYLKDLYKNDPKDWFKLINIMNDLTGYIDSKVPKFTDEEMYGIFKQSVRGRWEDHAEAEGFLDDKEKFMKYCVAQHKDDWDVCEKTAKDKIEYLASLMQYLHY